MIRISIFLIVVALIAGTVGSVAHQPIEIWNWYDLNATRDNMGGSYLLMDDLDFSTLGYEELASETASQGKGWQPIGTRNATFTGTFDGQGYEIRDLFINRPDEDVVGLFCKIGQKGVIKDIGEVNAIVTGHAFVGTLVGWNHGAVRDSYSRDNMTGDAFVGGLVGWNDGTVSNSYSDASVTGNGSVSGLVGSNDGTVSNSWSTGSVTGNMSVGGLVGNNNGYGTVSNSYSDASVTGNGSVGGLVGSNDGTVSNSYSTGSVTGDEYVGGLVGYTFDGTVSDSYSTASVSGSSSVGGLVGKDEISTVSNSFWDTETSGQATSDGGGGETTLGMMDFNTFHNARWSVCTVTFGTDRNTNYAWNIVDGQAYPFLSWQPVSYVIPSMQW